MNTVFSIGKDVEDDSYNELLGCLLNKLSKFHLVWLDNANYSDNAIEIREKLSRWEINRARRSAWPGICYSSSKPIATVIFYKTNPRQIEILKQTKSLFGWMSPKWPEDIGFYGEDGLCKFATVSHEKEGWLFDADIASLLSDSVFLEEEEWSEKQFEIFDSPVEL